MSEQPQPCLWNACKHSDMSIFGPSAVTSFISKQIAFKLFHVHDCRGLFCTGMIEQLNTFAAPHHWVEQAKQQAVPLHAS